MKIRWVGLFLWLCLRVAVFAEDAQVTARLDRTEISLGESTALRIIAQNSGKVEKIRVPEVADLDIQHLSQASNFQFINGVTSASVSHTYSVTPMKTGAFQIPSAEILIQGKTYKTSALTLQVTPSSVPKAPVNPDESAASPLPRAPSTVAKLAFLTLSFPKKELYVGEKIPVTVKAYFSSVQQVALRSLPQIRNEAFAVGDFKEKPMEAEEVFENQRYVTLTWQSTLDALKAGEYSMDGQVECTVVLNREPAQLRPRGFFDEFFSVREQRNLTLKSPSQALKVVPLPEEGKPQNFSGAVGKFELHAEAKPDRLAVGDPLTLAVIVSGSGNFNRLSAPEVQSDTHWKTYPASAQFEPSDVLGITGKKIFEQAIIPQKSGRMELPPVNIVYFDPELKQYQTITAPSMSAQVDPSLTSSTPLVSQTPVLHPSKPKEIPNHPSILAPNKVELGTLRKNIAPIVSHQLFLILCAILCVDLVILSVTIRIRRRIFLNPKYLRLKAASRAIRLQLERLGIEEQNGNAREFFDAARRILQEKLAESWGVKAETITSADIVARLPDAYELREIFEKADSIVYAGDRVNDLNIWKEKVFRNLKMLEEKQ
ncbi:MAG: BatD family protein [Verrucomicrobiota bacterium]